MEFIVHGFGRAVSRRQHWDMLWAVPKEQAAEVRAAIAAMKAGEDYPRPDGSWDEPLGIDLTVTGDSNPLAYASEVDVFIPLNI